MHRVVRIKKDTPGYGRQPAMLAAGGHSLLPL